MKKILIILFLFLSQKTYSNIDSLKGYNIYKFGQTKKEVINNLKNNLIIFDTSNKKIKSRTYCDSYIKYEDRFEIYIESFNKKLYNLEVILCFDSSNGDKFFKAMLNIKEFFKNIDEAKIAGSKILEIINKKYGNSNDTLDKMNDNSFLGKRIYYFWHFINGIIGLDLNFSDFFIRLKNEPTSDFSNIIKENGYINISIDYEDSYLVKKYRDNRIEFWKKEKENKQKDIENKF